MQHLRASRPGPDEVCRLFPVQRQFHEGPDINGFARPELARVQLFECGNGVLNFRRLFGLSTGQIGSFESAGVVFVLGLALLVRGFGARRLGRPEINLQFLRQPGNDLSDERAFVHVKGASLPHRHALGQISRLGACVSELVQAPVPACGLQSRILFFAPDTPKLLDIRDKPAPHQKVNQQTCDPSEVDVKSPRTLGRQLSIKDISSVTAEPTRGWDDNANKTKIVFV